jgi:serine/threonine-protein kinase RsbW
VGLGINLALELPRDSSTVPLVRHLTKHALWEIGVTRSCVADVELAVTEACANVVEHASGDDSYSVEVSVNAEQCEIRVVDTGRGFDYQSLDSGNADSEADRGRGIALMKVLVDAIDFRSEPERGTIVHLVKALEFDGSQPPFVEWGAPAD